MSVKKDPFRNWIDEYGQARLAKKLGVHPDTVLKWKNNHCNPRPGMMKKIGDLSKGRISYSAILER